MFSLPYQTTICGLYKNLDQVMSQVRRAQFDLPFPTVVTPSNYKIEQAAFVTPRDEHESIPNFTQYLNIGEPNNPKLLIDSRQYMKFDDKTGMYRIVSNNAWSFQCIRLALNLKLLNSDLTLFARMGDLPAKVFHRWVSGALTTKWNLTVETQMAMYVISTYYFYAMVNQELRDANKQEREQFIPIVSRITGVAPDIVAGVIEPVGRLANAGDLAYALSKYTFQERTGELGFADLYKLICNSWNNDPNARENVGVALEHLPTYIALLYMAIADRSYRKTVLSQRVDQLIRGNEAKVFTDLVFKFVDEQYSH